jgi:hypothetical protein
VAFNQVEFCLESWKKKLQPQKDMVILNSTKEIRFHQASLISSFGPFAEQDWDML